MSGPRQQRTYNRRVPLSGAKQSWINEARAEVVYDYIGFDWEPQTLYSTVPSSAAPTGRGYILTAPGRSYS